MQEDKVNEFFQVIRDEAIRPVFQPSVNLKNGEILAYEALSRITIDVPSINIEQLFGMADQLGQVWNLEKICRSKAIQTAAKKPKHKKIFLNVDANVILDSEFVKGFTNEYLNKYGLKTKDIVFELTERTSVAHFCKEMNLKAIAEGIETEEELKTVIRFGVSYGQGYFFRRPAKQFETIPDEIVNTIKEIHKKEHKRSYLPNFLGTIETICRVGKTMTPEKKAVEAYELFQNDIELSEICVIDAMGRLLAILTRNLVFKKFGGMYGYTLHQNQTVGSLMETGIPLSSMQIIRLRQY